MLDLLDSLPRLRVSGALMKAIMWVMRVCGTPDVPSFSKLRAKQTELTKMSGIPTEHQVSTIGNEFYVNSAEEVLKLVR